MAGEYDASELWQAAGKMLVRQCFATIERGQPAPTGTELQALTRRHVTFDNEHDALVGEGYIAGYVTGWFACAINVQTTKTPIPPS